MSTQLDVVAIGRVSVDLYGQQVGSRLEDISTFAKAVGGCPANVAIGAARLGLSAALITRVGDEPMGRFVREQLGREGVDTRGVRTDPQRLTSLVLLSVRDERSFPLIFYRENCADAALCEEDVHEELVGSARAVLVTGTHFSLPAAARAQRKAIGLAKARRSRVVLDIDYRPNLWGIGGHGAGESRYVRSEAVTAALATVLPDCDLIVGTEEELHIAGGVEDTLQAMRRIRAASAAVIVCKRGARGCVVMAGSIPRTLEEGVVVPGEPVEVYNVLGAGDAFLAGFLHGYLRDAPHEVSARQANACGAIAVSRLLCSSEFATLAELDHYLTRGSPCARLREDPALEHLHWATTRRREPAGVFALELGGPRLTDRRLAARSGELIELRRMIVEAVGRASGGSDGCGVLFGGVDGIDALRDALHRGLWAAGAVHRARSQPLDFEAEGSLAARLIEWPAGIVAACRYRYRPDEEPGVRAMQERNLLRLAGACRAQRRELLVGIEASGEETPGADVTVLALARLYEIGLRPDWWELAPQPGAEAWERCGAVIASQDEHCRGILVALRGSSMQAATVLAHANCPWVRGFTAGDSIFADAAHSWLTGNASATSTISGIAESFGALLAAWSALRAGGEAR